MGTPSLRGPRAACARPLGALPACARCARAAPAAAGKRRSGRRHARRHCIARAWPAAGLAGQGWPDGLGGRRWASGRQRRGQRGRAAGAGLVAARGGHQCSGLAARGRGALSQGEAQGQRIAGASPQGVRGPATVPPGGPCLVCAGTCIRGRSKWAKARDKIGCSIAHNARSLRRLSRRFLVEKPRNKLECVLVFVGVRGGVPWWDRGVP